METHDMSGDPSDGDHLSPSSSDGAGERRGRSRAVRGRAPLRKLTLVHRLLVGSRTGSVTTSSAPSDDRKLASRCVARRAV